VWFRASYFRLRAIALSLAIGGAVGAAYFIGSLLFELLTGC
jgi:hypothetical protein